MPVYLAPYVGTGVDPGDPFRPGTDQPAWSAIDLRPDQTVATGRCLLNVPAAEAITGADLLGDTLDAVLGNQTRTRLQNRLGVTLTATALRGILPELLIVHAREDGTRWKPLRVQHDGCYEVWLGERVSRVRAIAGGVDLTETFNQADSTTLGPNLTWAEIQGNMETVSNVVRPVTLNTTSVARTNDFADTQNYKVQAEITAISGTTAATANLMGTIVRKGIDSVLTFYHGRVSMNENPSAWTLFSFSAGAGTSLGTVAETLPSTPFVVRTSASGSTITLSHGDTTKIAVTNTAISGDANRAGGLRHFVGSAATRGTMDNFRMFDFGGAAHIVRGALIGGDILRPVMIA